MRVRRPLHLVLLAGAFSLLVALAVTAWAGRPRRRGLWSRRGIPGVCAARRGSPCACPSRSWAREHDRRSSTCRGPSSGPVPLLLALHGAHGSGAFMERYSGLSRFADRAGFAAVYPDAAGPAWRITAGERHADVRFLDALLDRLLSGGCFDAAARLRRRRVQRRRDGRPLRLRGRRPPGRAGHRGRRLRLAAGAARRAAPLSVLEIHGHGRPRRPLLAGPGRRGDVIRWLGEWAIATAARRGHGARGCPRRRPAPRLGALPRRDPVAHLRLVGGHHAWPGRDPGRSRAAFGVSASAEAWRFLRGRRLARPRPGLTARPARARPSWAARARRRRPAGRRGRPARRRWPPRPSPPSSP